MPKLGNPFKWLGRGTKKVVTAPVKAATKGGEIVMDALIKQLILMFARHGLTALGAVGALTGDDIQQLVSAVMIAAGLIWSAVRKIMAARQANDGAIGGPPTTLAP